MSEKIIEINGQKYYVLPEHSFHYCEYDNPGYGYSYQRFPVEGSTTVYADHTVTHVELRDDVDIVSEVGGEVVVSWDENLDCPFTRLL